MAKLLNCHDMDFECDFLCTETEEELFTWASQYVRPDQRAGETSDEFQERVRSALRNVAHC